MAGSFNFLARLSEKTVLQIHAGLGRYREVWRCCFYPGSFGTGDSWGGVSANLEKSRMPGHQEEKEKKEKRRGV